MFPRLCECCRQSQAEVISKSRNKIHQTWGPPFTQALYCLPPNALNLTLRYSDHNVILLIHILSIEFRFERRIRVLVTKSHQLYLMSQISFGRKSCVFPRPPWAPQPARLHATLPNVIWDIRYNVSDSLTPSSTTRARFFSPKRSFKRLRNDRAHIKSLPSHFKWSFLYKKIFQTIFSL